MVLGASRLQREIGYNPTRFRQMLGEMGGVDAAHRLLGGPATSDGFTTLWERRRLEMSVEAFVLLPWYAHLFTADELDKASQRLRDHDFDVEQHLRRAATEWPAWADEPEPNSDQA